MSFGFVKATEGDCFVDPMFGTNWPAMAQAGVVRSAYHFFHASVDPIAAADFHLQTMGPLRPGDLPPALDLEITDGEPADTITTNAIAWLDHVAAATGLLPILYVSPDFVSSTLGNPAGLESHAQLWIADWQVTCPDVPAPFATFGFWQNDSTGTVAGVGTNAVDTDVFNGSAADLAALTLPSPGGAGGSGGSSGAGGSSGTGGSGPGGIPWYRRQRGDQRRSRWVRTTRDRQRRRKRPRGERVRGGLCGHGLGAARDDRGAGDADGRPPAAQAHLM